MAVLFYCAGKVKFVEVEKELNKKQIGKRLLQVLIVLFGISFLTFGLTYLSPGDPAEIMLTECGNLPTPELLAGQTVPGSVRQLAQGRRHRRHGNFLFL